MSEFPTLHNRVRSLDDSPRYPWFRDWYATNKAKSRLLSSIEATPEQLEEMERSGTATAVLEHEFEERLGL